MSDRAPFILSFVALLEASRGYFSLIGGTNFSQNWTLQDAGLGTLTMAGTSRVKRMAGNGVPHLPFQEFTASTLEALLNLLRRAKIKDSEIEVSTSEESQHTACSVPLVHVLVMTAKGEGPGEHKDLAALYQYCPECHAAVRVL